MSNNRKKIANRGGGIGDIRDIGDQWDVIGTVSHTRCIPMPSNNLLGRLRPYVFAVLLEVEMMELC